MSDKPLAEQWDDDARREDWPENGDFLTPQKCAAQLRRFAAEHLTEQTEPSDEHRLKAIKMLDGTGYFSFRARDYIAEALLQTENELRRRIRELLVGKETK